MHDWTEMTPLMRRVMVALMNPIQPGEFGDGIFLDPAEMRLRATGSVREERIKAACPEWVQRVPGPGGPAWESHVTVTYECAEDFRGEIADLLDGLLRGVLEQFVTVAGVRVTIWEGADPPHDRKMNFRFKVRGQRREEATDADL